jgi:hypothetical protein
MAQDTVVWLYAVVRGLGGGQLPADHGVGGVGPRILELGGGVGAVVAAVDAAQFGEEPLRRNLEDRQWLEATARAHDAVIDAVSHIVPTVPIRLATVYHNEDRVRAMLVERHDDVVAALDRVTGRTEWGVKIYAEPSAESSAPEPSTRASTDGTESAPGTAYLRRRRAQLSAREAAQDTVAADVRDIHAALDRIAIAARLYPAQQHPTLTRERRRMILNSTYLVDDESIDEFSARVVSLATEHSNLKVELTGPWPAYSFAGVEQESQS